MQWFTSISRRRDGQVGHRLGREMRGVKITLPPRPAAPNPDAAFLSGTAEKDRAEDAKGGMLKEICERGIVIFKE